jgi:formylglycine-generating enzyme required for sulfatase activity
LVPILAIACGAAGLYVVWQGPPAIAVTEELSMPSESADAAMAKDETTAAPEGMVLIPAGMFTMGSPAGEGEDDEHPAHEVHLDAFYMDIYEVTNGQFAEFVDATQYVTQAEKNGRSWAWDGKGWNEQEGADWRHPAGPESSIENVMQNPVEHLSWDDAVAYASWAGKRLPTEAEWEYACRAGTTTRYATGEKITHDEANFEGTGGSDKWKQGAPVGSFAPNAWGLYDMHGNVWERCADWYSDDYYSASPPRNPEGPKEGRLRVLRGGSWYNYAHALRSSNRYLYGQSITAHSIGFRCVKDVD